MPDRYVLDAYALLAFFAEEEGADRVAAIVEKEDGLGLAGPTNLVYHVLCRQEGRIVLDSRNLDPG